MSNGLRSYLEKLAEKKLLARVEAEVNPVLEITEISDRLVKSGGPAVYFNNVKGSDYPVVTNLFGSMERVNIALNTSSLDDLAEEISSLIQLANATPGLSVLEKVKLLPKFAELASITTKLVKDGPCQEIVEENPSLDSLPVLQCWPKDGGRFITLPLVFTKDLETGQRNVGMYRMQVFDERKAGMHWHIHKDGAEHFRKARKAGKHIEVAVVLGSDPAVIYASTAPLPANIDELLLASYLKKSPVKLVKCKTIDLEVPADAEFILEGIVDPEERRIEGPFGDHTGYYSPAEEFPVFRLKCLTRRSQPIYPATIVGRPPMEDAYLGKVTEKLFLPMLKLYLPEIVDIHFPWEGVFHNCVLVSINKKYPGQAQKVMHGLWGLGQMALTKIIIVVDAEVNVQDKSEVWWRVFGNIDPQRDLNITNGALDVLDHSSPQPKFGSKLGVDATKKWPEEGHVREWPEAAEMTREVVELVNKRWKEYGLE